MNRVKFPENQTKKYSRYFNYFGGGGDGGGGDGGGANFCRYFSL